MCALLDDLGELDRLAIEGVVFSYELFDAFPVHRLIGRAGGDVGELLVDWTADQGLVYVEGDLSDGALAELLGDRRLEPGRSRISRRRGRRSTAPSRAVFAAAS